MEIGTSSLVSVQSDNAKDFACLHDLDLRRLNLSKRLPDDLFQRPSFSRDALRTLLLDFNYLTRLPPEILSLTNLEHLSATRNNLAPSGHALLVEQQAQHSSGKDMEMLLKDLPNLRVVDLRFNRRCGSPDLVKHLRSLGYQVAVSDLDLCQNQADNNEMGSSQNCQEKARDARLTNDGTTMVVPLASSITIRLTLWGQMVGAMPSLRDAQQLRAQIEPWPTAALRKRLLNDFNYEKTSKEEVDLEDLERNEVMNLVLAQYQKEGLMAADGVSLRKRSHVDGVAVDPDLLEKLLIEMKKWTAAKPGNAERPSVAAEDYMILRSPKKREGNLSEFHSSLSNQDLREQRKLNKHKSIWDLAEQAISSVDPEFAKSFTALALTHNFAGSPHIDKQNTGPFYGLAFGDFEDGTGAICVELNAREIGVVNTKNRLAKVDGRYPHWVDKWVGEDRYSLIFYETELKRNAQYVQPGRAVFGEQVSGHPLVA